MSGDRAEVRRNHEEGGEVDSHITSHKTNGGLGRCGCELVSMQQGVQMTQTWQGRNKRFSLFSIGSQSI
jgi:hypothetical protein